MNAVKQISLILAMAACIAPIGAADRSERASSNLPWAAAFGAAGAAIAGGAAYYTYQWYTRDHYWSIHGITRQVEKMIKDEFGYPNKLDWNGNDTFLHHRHSLKWDHGRVALTIKYDSSKKAWVVITADFDQGSSHHTLADPGRLTVQADCEQVCGDYTNLYRRGASAGMQRKYLQKLYNE